MQSKLEPDDEALVYSAEICADFGGITDRALRKWIILARFPRPDGNLHGRNFWFMRTVREHKAAVIAGRYAQLRRPLPAPTKAA